ncbi:Uncharacterised protein [Mycobacterium tuberculosis]|nr:Uncharacterised protein [Mycobacterium tuberculosis]
MKIEALNFGHHAAGNSLNITVQTGACVKNA